MPEATQDLTTPAPAPEFPTIMTLGRMLAHLERQHHRHDVVELKATDCKVKKVANAAKDALQQQMAAVRDLIAALPARSLQDVAVQIEAAAFLADDIAINDLKRWQIKQFAEQLVRMMAGSLHVVAAAAGLDMEEMDWTQWEHMRVTRFFGPESEV